MSNQPVDIVEEILRHRERNGVIVEYHIKWLGYDIDASTWESVQDIEADFPAMSRKYKNKVAQEKKMPLESIKEVVVDSKEQDSDSEDYMDFAQHLTDWESEVDYIATVERSQYSGLVVYVVWKNGKKTVHHSTEIYAKCPEKMLDFFEANIVRAKITAKDLDRRRRQGRSTGLRRN